MGKGDRRREGDINKFDDGYDRIFGKDKQVKGGRWIMDEQTGKLIPEEEYVPSNKVNDSMPMVFFRGEGWPTKKFKKMNNYRKQLEKDPFWTSCEDKRERLGENIERQREMNKKMQMGESPNLD